VGVFLKTSSKDPLVKKADQMKDLFVKEGGSVKNVSTEKEMKTVDYIVLGSDLAEKASARDRAALD
jgi:hypothetical protein